MKMERRKKTSGQLPYKSPVKPIHKDGNQVWYKWVKLDLGQIKKTQSESDLFIKLVRF